MAKISRDMIHPDLRKKVKSVITLPTLSLRLTKLIKIVYRFLRGSHSRMLRYTQQYIIRPDGTKLRICVHTPLKQKENVPGLLWIHGGGYAIGIPEQDKRFIRGFVQASGCVVVTPDYTLSIDKPYPAAMEDCYAALLWLRDNGAAYGMRSDQIFVGGNSAGGGLTAAVTLYARDRGDVKIAFQMPLYPMIDDRPTESSTDNNTPVWNSALNEAAWRLYLGAYYGSSEVPIYAAPGRATNFAGLPPACSFVGSIEPFYDETVAFMENLKKSGVPVHFKIFDNCFHAFDQMCWNTDIAKKATAFLIECFTYAVENYFAAQNGAK